MVFDSKEFNKLFNFKHQVEYIENSTDTKWGLLIKNKYLSENFLNKYFDSLKMVIHHYEYLSEEFMLNHKEELNWNLISKHQMLSKEFIINNRDVITNKCIKNIIDNRNSDGDIVDIYINDGKRFELVYIIEYGKLGEEFIEKYKDEVDWFYVSKNEVLSNEFIEKYKDKLDLNSVVQKSNMSEELILKNIDKIALNIKSNILPKYLFSKKGLSEEFIKKCFNIYYGDDEQSKMNESDKCKLIENQVLSEEFIERYKYLFNNEHWKLISKHQILSEGFIEGYENKVGWFTISKYQTLSEEFIKRNENKLFTKDMLSFQNVSSKYFSNNFKKIKYHGLLKVNKLSEETIRDNINNLNIDYIFENILVSNKFIDLYLKKEKMKEDNNYKELMEIIVKNQDLSEEFIEEYLDDINFYKLAKNKNIKIKTLKKYKKFINLNKIVITNVNISSEDKLKMENDYLRFYKVYDGDAEKLKSNHMIHNKETLKLIEISKKINESILDKKYEDMDCDQIKIEISEKINRINRKSYIEEEKNKKRKKIEKRKVILKNNELNSDIVF